MADWNLAICGQDSAGKYKVWTCVYGDGYSQSPGTWSSLAELTVANPGSNVEFRCPYVNFPDVFRIFFVEKYSGTASYSRALCLTPWPPPSSSPTCGASPCPSTSVQALKVCAFIDKLLQIVNAAKLKVT